MDNTFTGYKRLLINMINYFESYTIEQYLKIDDFDKNKSGILLLRHDVEKSAAKAKKMATIENMLGLNATYYFRKDTKAYNIPVMKKIRDLGHEIGYHYNCLDRTNGNFKAAWELFKSEVKEFREDGFKIETICMHGQPRINKSGYEKNGDLFNKYNYKSLAIKGEAYLDIDFDIFKYVSDTGISWSDYKTNQDLVAGTKNISRVYLLTHPDYWFSNRIFAIIANQIKKSEFLKDIVRKIARF